MKIKVAVVSGSLRNPSRTHGLLEAIVYQLHERFDVEVHWVQISDLATALTGTLERASAPECLVTHLTALEHADLIIAGSPVYRASYTGLFKHLFDLVDYQQLKGIPVLLAATGGSERHALMIDHQLRPLFGFFQAHTLPFGIYATAESFSGYQLVDGNQLTRIQAALSPLGVFFVPQQRTLRDQQQ